MAAPTSDECSDKAIDVVDVRDSEGGSSRRSLRNEIVAGLTTSQGVYTACEEGFSDVRWTKQLPSSELTSCGMI